MASGGQRGIDQDLVNIGKLRLKPDDLHPMGVVVVGGKLVITDSQSNKVRVYRRHEGMLLSSTDELESDPNGVCRVNDTDLCVAMNNGIIAIMSVQDSGLISRGKTFDLGPSFDHCCGVALWNDNIVVIGVKDGTICWCVVSLKDGRPDKLQKVCRGNSGFLTVKQDMVYISCFSLSNDGGVYGFNLLNPSQPTYTYKHEGLSKPCGITVNDIGDLFVCNLHLKSICHLTGKCELVAIYKDGLPRFPLAIFWDSGVLYLASHGSNKITMYKTPQQDPLLPVEILSMDSNSIQLYKKALHAGKEKVYNIRVMVVGQFGVGKTTLIKRLLGQQVDIAERKSTEGIDVHKHCCKISLDNGEWIQQHEDSDQLNTLKRLNKLLADQKLDINQEQDDIGEVTYQREIVEVIYQREITSEIDATKNNSTSTTSVSDHEVQSSTHLSNTRGDEIHHVEHLEKETDSVAVPLSDAKSSESGKTNDTMMEIICLVNENADKLVKDIEKYAALSIWDFAGQYTFYTTHQMFLTSRAIYLLVIDLSQHITNRIQDDKCFLDAEGIKERQVLDLIQIWMNSIHYSVPSPEAIIPVILVGTHVDKLSEKSRKEAIDKYFIELRYMLREKPIIRYLMDDIAIDNTQPDPMLEKLRKRIFKLSSRQPHWGEEKPARWLPLEHAIMTLRASGTKVVPLSLIEEINMSGSVKIVDRNELELFLKFHHEMGTILYFSVEELREKIVVDPQWMIDALKSLITAETFIKKNPAITSKFYEFIKTGKLTHELIDVIWTKENNPEFHKNKDHILRLMEQLNIIAMPRIFSEEGKETKEERYFLAPCMLQQETPEEIISPKPNTQIGSSSVLCYVFKGNFLPSAIFHRLVAACIAHWPVAIKRNEHREENLIFCGCCVFQLDKQHKLILHFREHVIFLRVTRMGIKDKTPSSKLCIEVREFITRNLLKIIGYLGKGLEFECFVQCPDYNGVSINSLIPVSELNENAEVPCEFHDHIIESCDVLDFWFEDQEQYGDGDASSAGPMPSAPISDKDRFMCIAYLLNDVGSKVLRQLFHDMVTPTYTLDQHLANNRGILNSLLKKKVLNVSQMDIMFPPNGDPTNLTDYDITLLSALFNNIMPSLGHQEKNLIKSLRDNRNKLYGHTKCCKMNAGDFQTCWSDISSTLITLSQQCGDINFKNEISSEIQQTRVPDASYLSMIQTLYSRIERIEQRLESNNTSTNET